MLIAGKPYTLLEKDITSQIKFASPNLDELLAIAKVLCPDIAKSIDMNSLSSGTAGIVEAVKAIGPELLKTIDNLLITLGHRGVILLTNHDPNEPYYKDSVYLGDKKNSKTGHGYFYSMEDNGGNLLPKDIVNVSGAGDSFTSGFITGMLQGLTGNQCIYMGMAAAKCALKSPSAVPKTYDLNVKDMPRVGASGQTIF